MTLRRLGLSSLLFAIPSFANALTLDCQLKPNSSTGGWVTERYVIQYDEPSDQAIVSDGVILSYNDNQPIMARVAEDSARKLVVTWNLQMTNKIGQMTKMQFRAAYFKAEGTVTVRAVPGGYDNSFEARGHCQAV